MNAYIENDWKRAISADPRIVDLADIAYDLVWTGGQGTHDADAVYGDMKPYLGRLVGFDRGGSVPDPRRVLVPELAARMLQVISQPFQGDARDEVWLGGSRAYDVCHGVIYGNLCDIYDERWSRG